MKCSNCEGLKYVMDSAGCAHDCPVCQSGAKPKNSSSTKSDIVIFAISVLVSVLICFIIGLGSTMIFKQTCPQTCNQTICE